MRPLVGAMIASLCIAGCTPRDAPNTIDAANDPAPDANANAAPVSGTGTPETVEKLVSGEHGTLTDHELGPDGVTYEIDRDGDMKPDAVFTDIGNDGSIDAKSDIASKKD